MKTPRLYLDDPLLASFEARVVKYIDQVDRKAVVLDRTAFYPESGGQQADRGTLAGIPVVDVQQDEGESVLHFLAGPLPPVGVPVAGQIDMDRRRQHMAQHTGQHLLSQALLRTTGARTRSSHLGESQCTLDVDRTDLSRDELREAESLVNRVIDQDLEVRAWMPTPDELPTLALRRSPKVARDIRVVSVAGFDHTPCGGTHCTRTGQVGLLLVLNAEQKKGNTRITFAAGSKARDIAREQRDNLQDAAQRLGSDFAQVPDLIGSLIRQRDEAQRLARSLGKGLARAIAKDLLTRTTGHMVIARLDEAEADVLLEVAKRITSHPDRVALLAAPREDRLQVLALRGNESRFDCGEFVRRLCQSAGGQGGGRPDHARGVVPDMDAQAWIGLVNRSM